MAEAILMKGGGTVYSEDCTAVATNILDGKTALHLGSNDEISAGSMPNYANATKEATIFNATAATTSLATNGGIHVDNKGYIRVTQLPWGYYSGSTDTGGVSTIRFQPTAALGNASFGHVLSGYKFTSNTGAYITGNMPNYAGVATVTGGAGDKPATNTIRIKIANTGYYNTNSYVQTTLSKFGSSLGTASRGHVLKDITFTSTAGVATSGTMPNHNNTSTNTATAFSYSSYLWIKSLSSSGYYTSSTSVKTNIPVYAGGFTVS